MSSPLDQFVDLANAQGAAYPHGDEIPWSADRPQDFAGLAQFLVGRDNQMYFDAGTSIQTQFDGEIASTQFGPKRPAADHRRAGGVNLSFLATEWTEYEWTQEISWHQINLQGGGGVLSDVNSQRFWNILKKHDKDFTIDALKQMEKDIYAAPTAAMFGDDGTGLMPLKSLHAGCNVWEKKHYASGGGDGLFPVMATQQGLDPDNFRRTDSYGKEYSTDASQLAATKVSYAASSAGTNSTTGDHLLDQFQYLLDLLQWRPIPLAGEFAEGQALMPSVITCTREAKRSFCQTNRAHGELFAVINPIGDPAQGAAQYGGIPLLTSDSLRDAEVYPDISGGVSTAAAAYLALGRGLTERDTDGNAGGYFYFLDPRCVNLWFHRNRAWEKDDWETMAPLNKDIMFRLGRFLGNLHFERFVTNGILMPDGDVANYS